jgi:4'-phosphopantetheinyl transferase
MAFDAAPLSARHGNALPAAGEIHLWFCGTNDPPVSMLTRYRTLLAAKECERLQSFRFEALQRVYLIGRALLRSTLSAYCPEVAPRDWNIGIGEFGKPHAPEAEHLQFNLSHAGDWLALAVRTAGPVGIDIERIAAGQNGLEIAENFFCPSEYAWLRSQPGATAPARFVSLWTLKEAYLKALGTGLSSPLSSLVLDLSVLPEILYAGPPSDHRWALALGSLGHDYRVAIAAPLATDAGPLRIRSRHRLPLVDERPNAPTPIGMTPRISWV